MRYKKCSYIIINITEESLIRSPIKLKFNKLLCDKLHKLLIPVDPAGPDCYLGEDKPCESNGIPKFPMANCSITHDQLAL